MKESQHTEWKESWRDDYLRWICGFANAEGGVLVIGRNDKGKVVGVPEAKRLLVELPNKIRDLLGIIAEANGLWIEFPCSPDYLALIRGAPAETPVETLVETLVKTPEGILAILSKQPTLTLAEVAGALDKSTSAVERAARRLREQGRLHYVGPKKGGRWEIVP